VLTAINLNDEAMVVTVKVHDVRTDRLLSAEF
jgi:hypothetical protein